MKRLFALCAMSFLVVPVVAQEPPKPGPEHEMLKKHVGKWDLTIKSPHGDGTGTAEYTMALSDMWLICKVEMDMGGMKFEGRSADSYDATKKKYTGVWIDAFRGSPMVMEGDLDKEKKTLTMIGDAPGPDGKMIKHRMVSTMTDDDNFTFSMYHGDAKDAMMTITYKRKK